MPDDSFEKLGHRIHVMGNSCAGKSTLAAQLAERIDADFVELDALNWLPNWVGLNATDPDRLTQRISDATAGDRWVVAGSYMKFSQAVFWPRLQTVIWLDLPMHVVLYRAIRRSWQRSRSKELLWGTNRETFWKHLKLWDIHESLIAWVITQHRRKRREVLGYMADPRWSHIRFIRLQSQAEIRALGTGPSARSN